MCPYGVSSVNRSVYGVERDAHCNCRKDDARPGEIIRMVEALPDRISSTFSICVEGSLPVRTSAELLTRLNKNVARLGIKPELVSELKKNLCVGSLTVHEFQ